MNSVLQKRRWRAIGITCLLFIFVGISAHIEGYSSSGYALQAADELFFGKGVLRDDSGLLRQTPAFMNEIGLPADAYEVKFQEKVNTVGYVVPQSLVEFYPQLFSALRVRGWEEIDSNLVGTGTFVKETGDYRWIFVNCVDVADGCSVVLQYQVEEG